MSNSEISTVVPTNMLRKETWQTIPDSNVHHIWEHSKANKTDICGECGEDFEYLRTELNVFGSEWKGKV